MRIGNEKDVSLISSPYFKISAIAPYHIRQITYDMSLRVQRIGTTRSQ
ncbi:hypothetical protein [Nostoc cycadae]|nr:hypothetical protein [Nostoc cycadae]